MFPINERRIRIFNIVMIPLLLFVYIIPLLLTQIYEKECSYCVWLPALFIVGYVVFFLTKKNNFLDIHIIIIFLFFIKLYVLPLCVIFVGDFNVSEYNADILRNVFDSVVVQAVEWISIVLGLIFFRVNKNIKSGFVKKTEKEVNSGVWYVIGICFIVIVGATAVFPSLLYKFRPIFFLSEKAELIWKQKSTIAVSTIHPLIYYPLNWLITITRFSVIYLLLLLVWRKSNAMRDNAFSLVLSLIIIVVGLVVIVPDDVSASIIAAISAIALLIKLYPRQANKLLSTTIIASFCLFLYMFFLRAFVVSANIEVNIEKLSERLNAYFSGFINCSAVFEMKSENKLLYFCGDFCRSLPVLKGFFVNMPTTTELFNVALGYDTVYNSQIIPLEGQAYFYFGYIGVVLIPLIVLKVCFSFYNRSVNAQGSYDFFINCFFSLLVAFGIVMYDAFLIFDLCLIYVPMLLINIFMKKRKEKNNERIDIFRCK